MSDCDLPSTTRLPAPSPDVVARRVGDETVLVHLGTNRIFALNHTGDRFWQLLVEGKSRDEIERTLQREYDVPGKKLSDEIDMLLAELRREQILGIPADNDPET